MFGQTAAADVRTTSLMGCAPSSPFNGRGRHSDGEHYELVEWLETLQSSGDPYDMLSAYIKVEKDILNGESQSPAAKLNVATSRLQHIKSLIQSASEKGDKQEKRNFEESAIYEVFVDLGLQRDGSVAAEHEEFIANLNRNALNLNFLAILERGSALLEEDIQEAMLQVNRLQILYEKQDMLLGRVYGENGIYGSEKERLLDEELDVLRNYRDAFFGGTSRWESAASNVGKAAELMTRGVASWRSAWTGTHVQNKISAAIEARNAIQEAIVLIEMSNDSIPAVQFPYCSRRQLTSVSQAIEYVFTDMLIEDRHSHASQVFRNLQERATALWQWINQILNSSLKADLTGIDRGILEVSRNLRNERIAIICGKLGIENSFPPLRLNSLADGIFPKVAGKSATDGIGKMEASRIAPRKGRQRPFGMEAAEEEALAVRDWHGEFERKLAARKGAMWPSRRVEELRTSFPDPQSL